MPRYNPYEIIQVLEIKLNITQIPGVSQMERCRRIWLGFRHFWSEERTADDIQLYLKQVRGLLKLLLGALMHPTYRTASKARWVCMLKTGLRLLYGLAASIRHGSRRHISMLHRTGPISVMWAAAVYEEQGIWPGATAAPLLEKYLSQLDEMLWGLADPEQEAGKGLSYTRFGISWHKGYTGWDKVFRYKDGWPAVGGRDRQHDITTWCPQNPEYTLQRSKAGRQYPRDGVGLLVNSVASSEETKNRETWSLVHYQWPTQARPRRKRGLRLLPRRRPRRWFRRRQEQLSLREATKYNYDVIMLT